MSPVSVAHSRLLYDALKACGIGLVSALPETWLVHLIGLAEEDPEMILMRLAKEEEGVGISAGAHLAGMKSAMLMQNHGFRGRFEHGGWALPYNDSVKGQIMAAGMAQAGPLLFGRRTYEDFFSVWPKRKDNPFTEVLDNAHKYVASTTLIEPLPWRNSTLLKDVADAVAPVTMSRFWIAAPSSQR